MASAMEFVVVLFGASFNSFVRFFDENIKKSQSVVQFHFLDKLNLIVHSVKITKKYVNRGDIGKRSETIVNIATKELWLIIRSVLSIVLSIT